MELHFRKSSCSFIEPVIMDVQNQEQVQEIRLTEGMPDISGVLAVWGQPVLRAKEWNSDRVSVSCGMAARILYLSEGVKQPQLAETWIPFSFRWDLPDNASEGKMMVSLRTRFMDVRSVSPRKMIVRAGLSSLMEAFSAADVSIYHPGDVPGDVQLLTAKYPVRLDREVGEKNFDIEENIGISASENQKLLAWNLQPEITEKKVLGNKIAFRGNVNLHVILLNGEDDVESYDYPLAFSQFAELSTAYGSDGEVLIRLCVTDAEADLDQEGLRVKCSIAAQYAVSSGELIEIVQDGYSTSRELQLIREDAILPSLLDNRRETVSVEQDLPAEAENPVDEFVSSDIPNWNEVTEGRLSGSVQTLYKDRDGMLRCDVGRWTGTCAMNSSAECRMVGVPLPPVSLRTTPNGEHVQLKFEEPVDLIARTGSAIPQIASIVVGDEIQRDSNRPSMVLRRAGEYSLWEIAKQTGSSVEAIRKINEIESEPYPGQMLLIPIM